ncbi:hypothetical protein [uncultured Reyranella sp.]|nr:hypothetical protein [uncultured Reyranella sp.]
MTYTNEVSAQDRIAAMHERLKRIEIMLELLMDEGRLLKESILELEAEQS